MTKRRKRRIKLVRRWVCLMSTRQIISLAMGALVLVCLLSYAGACDCAETRASALIRHSIHHNRRHHQHQLQHPALSQPVVVGNLCSLLPMHVARQLRLCKLMQASSDAAEAVRNGTANGLMECRRLFQDQRWNCTHSSGDHQLLVGDFGQTLGLRESSFVQAITAAALVHSVASACSLGSLKDCACDRTRVGTIKHHEEKWKWGGCSHNIRQGMQFAKYHVELLDAVHQYQAQPAERRHGAQLRHFRHNLLPTAAAAAMVAASSQQQQQVLAPCPAAHQNLSRANHLKLIGSLLASDSLERHQVLRLAVNMHNNRVGRMAVANNMELKCRCHGLSGSCSMKTCWLALPDLQQVGAYLKRKYDAALHLPAAVDLNRLIPMMDRDELSSVLSEELRLVGQQTGEPIRLPPAYTWSTTEKPQETGQRLPVAQLAANTWPPRPDSPMSLEEELQVAPFGQQQYLGLLRDLRLCSGGGGGGGPLAPAHIQQQHHQIKPNNSAHLMRRAEQHQLMSFHQTSATGHYIRSANQHLAQVLAHSRNKEDLIYLHKSPDFCQPQARIGFSGLSGRICSLNGTSHDNCDKLCCNSGYSLRSFNYPYTCPCKFKFCCSIVCEKCNDTAEFHVCN